MFLKKEEGCRWDATANCSGWSARAVFDAKATTGDCVRRGELGCGDDLPASRLRLTQVRTSSAARDRLLWHPCLAILRYHSVV
jgi:hypothetical protein